MAISIRGWLRGIVGGGNGGERLGNANVAYQPVEGNTTMPGGYAQASPPASILPTASLRSTASGGYTRQGSAESFGAESLRWLQFLIIKPIIILLQLIFRILAKVLNIIYFQDGTSAGQNGILRGNVGGRGAMGSNVRVGRSRSGLTSQLRRSAAVLPHNSSSSSLSPNCDPIDKVNKFVCELEDNLTLEQLHNQQYSTIDGNNSSNNTSTVLPPFYQGSYTQALYMATSRAKFLYVYLTNSKNENSSIIFEKIVTNPEFTNIFNSNNPDVIIWGGDLTNPEAYQLANSLSLTKFPFLGILCLTRSTNMTPQGPTKTSPRISLISKIQGGINPNVNPSTIIDSKFIKKMARYAPELASIRVELREKFMNRAILKQQNMNYEMSLARDKLKKQEKLDEQRKGVYYQWRSNYFRKLIAEGSDNHNGQVDKARIAIKLKNGERKTLYFPSESDVRDIFEFTEMCQRGLLNDDDSGDAANVEEEDWFDEFKPSFNFKLVSPLPPKVTINEYLADNAGVMIKNIACVYPNGLLIVED
ncbi:hypothetical protein CLIB1423_12S03752 [[Candida] railenensis]|uniref:UBX domain-containing protein n=1 Tax=[Candida] railenensis TaxID=45579 RepID=A0A9P0QSZ8_9ASCO|nr:hypothetical protein CLIB1423_12S03752 [[Candida] railenensis]